MRYRTLGKTGLSVSEIGFGGEWLHRLEATEVQAIVDRAAELGVNIVDCWMSDPSVRTMLGDAIARSGRDRWYVQGHVGSTWQGGQYVRTRDVEACKVAFDDLLRRFHTDHIDLGMIHYIDSMDELRSSFDGPYLDYVLDLKRQGVIKHIGMSTHSAVCGQAAIDSGVVEMLLFSVNPAYDMQPAGFDIETLASGAGAEFEGFDQGRMAFYRSAERNNVGITVMKTFAGGRLLDGARSAFGVGLTPAQCIHYALTRPAVASVILGFTSVDEVDADVAYETATEEERDYASVLATAPHNPTTGLCTYCGHCAPCTVGIDIARVNKFYDLAEVQVTDGGEVPALVRDHYLSLDHTADECVGCSACEDRCPFSVGIVERMAAAAELFGR